MINVGPNGGSDDGLFWQVGSSATLGTSTDFEGNILAAGEHHAQYDRDASSTAGPWRRPAR